MYGAPPPQAPQPYAPQPQPALPPGPPQPAPLDPAASPSSSPSSSPAPPPAAGSTLSYIGCPLSLISKANLRYEGLLYTIDATSSTVALSSVRCFGTEGRVSGADYVPPSPAVYEFIVFSGRDIKDLHILQRPEAEAQHSQQQLRDPAIVSSAAATLPPPAPAPAPAAAPSSAAVPDVSEEERRENGEEPPSVQSLSLQDEPSPHRQQPQQQHSFRGRGRGRGGRDVGGYNSHSPRQQQQQQPRYTVSILSSRPLDSHELRSSNSSSGSGGGSSASRGPDVSTAALRSDFDFVSSTARFNKDEYVSELKGAEEKEKQQQQQQHAAADEEQSGELTVQAPAYTLPKADDDTAAPTAAEADKPVIAVKCGEQTPPTQLSATCSHCSSDTAASLPLCLCCRV